MDLQGEVEQLRSALKQAENIQTELDRRVFHLKTLYDVSTDIFGSVEFETILKNFLLMTMGNFGVMEGFILTLEGPSNEIARFVSMGFPESEHPSLQSAGRKFLQKQNYEGLVISGKELTKPGILPPKVACVLPFIVESGCIGLLGLGGKIVGELYNDDDKELLVTLVNNLVVALKNSRSFEEIKHLNEDLQEKNIKLEKTLKELQAALKKVEILESVKAQLSKFVPSTVSRLIDKSPSAPILDSKEQDVSVLFLDIEGYTKMSESLESAELNKVIEKCFSVFMDAIYENKGDVMETAGDGLMVLFMDEDEKANALEAVRTAVTIREKTALINQEFRELPEPLMINMGINSGQGLVGAAKFESLTGSRWTFTARGMVTNVAGRLGAFATGGAVVLSRSTADRVNQEFALNCLGKFSLKNVSEEVEIFQVEGKVSGLNI
jgi:class 3 adenylate cyclase